MNKIVCKTLNIFTGVLVLNLFFNSTLLAFSTSNVFDEWSKKIKDKQNKIDKCYEKDEVKCPNLLGKKYFEKKMQPFNNQLGYQQVYDLNGYVYEALNVRFGTVLASGSSFKSSGKMFKTFTTEEMENSFAGRGLLDESVNRFKLITSFGFGKFLKAGIAVPIISIDDYANGLTVEVEWDFNFSFEYDHSGDVIGKIKVLVNDETFEEKVFMPNKRPYLSAQARGSVCLEAHVTQYLYIGGSDNVNVFRYNKSIQGEVSLEIIK